MMKCKNCGQEIDQTLLKNLKKKRAELEAQLKDIAQRIDDMENGFCDGYCRFQYEEQGSKE